MITYPQVFAHRGASGNVTENTLAAMTRAHADGAKWVEFDVMLAQCGTPIVFHDEQCQRLANLDSAIATTTYRDLIKLRINNGRDLNHHTIPNFVDMVDHLAALSLCANIEIKPLANQDEQTTQEMWAAVQAYYQKNPGKFIFSSFSVRALETLRELAPTVPMALLLHEWTPAWQEMAQRLAVIGVHLNVAIVTPERIQQIRAAGYQLAVYTVNDRAEATRLLQLGVSAVFTDYPARMKDLLA